MKRGVGRLIGFFVAMLMVFGFMGCTLTEFMFFPFNSCATKDAHQTLKEHLLKIEDDGADLRSFGDYDCMIWYDEEESNLSFTLFYDDANGESLTVGLDYLSEDNEKPEMLGVFEANGKTLGGTGYIERSYFSSSNKYIYDFKVLNQNSASVKTSLKELFATSIDLMLMYANIMIKDYNIDITLGDLGFTNYN